MISWVGDEVQLKIDAKDNDGNGPGSVTVDVYDQDNTLITDDGTATISTTTVTYTLAETITDTAGLYRAVFKIIFTGTVTKTHNIIVLVRDQTIRSSIYGDVQGVEDRIGDIVTSRVFTDSTIPSYDVVERWVETVSSEVNVELIENGYQVPISAVDDPQAYEAIREAVHSGAAARVLASNPAEVYSFPDENSQGGNRRTMLDRELWHMILRIRDHRLPATRSGSFTVRTYSGAYENRETGETKYPLFTRGKFDYPSSRKLETGT
jgi:hypothetical protein